MRVNGLTDMFKNFTFMPSHGAQSGQIVTEKISTLPPVVSKNKKAPVKINEPEASKVDTAILIADDEKKKTEQTKLIIIGVAVIGLTAFLLKRGK